MKKTVTTPSATSTVVVDGQIYEKTTPKSTDSSITLGKDDLNKLSMAVGGKILKTADDVTKLFIDNFRISVNGTQVDLDPEDTNSLKERFDFGGYPDFDTYMKASVQDAIHLYLWGSTRGLLNY